MYFKNEKNWKDIDIDELAYREELADDDDKGHTKRQLLEIVNNNEETARTIFERLTWQSPYTLLGEDQREGEIDEYYFLIGGDNPHLFKLTEDYLNFKAGTLFYRGDNRDEEGIEFFDMCTEMKTGDIYSIFDLKNFFFNKLERASAEEIAIVKAYFEKENLKYSL